ncbi:MAG: phosphatidylglycerophosphatase A [Variovorax sp.]
MTTAHTDSLGSRPSLRFMFAHPAHWIALGFGSGLSPIAPGTAGTLWAWAAFLMAERLLSPLALGLLIGVSLPLGWWACSVTARHLQVADPGAIVWDEVVGFWLVLWLLLPAGFWLQLLAFVLFRIFDAAKPGPIGWADRAFKPREAQGDNSRWWRAGFGILLDDLVAAFCTLLLLAVGRAW